MTTIVTRAAKGSALTWTEADANFTNLNTAKFEVGVAVPSGTAKAIPYLSVSNVMSLSSLFVYDGSNFGVGIASPISRFHIRAANASGSVNVATFDVADVANPANIQGLRINVDPVGNYVQLSATGYTTGGFTFFTGNNERMRIQPDGNVGIGTVSASSKLDVAHSGDGSITYRTSTRAISIGQLGGEPTLSWGSGTPLRFFAGAERMRVHASGGMSLGNTTDPGATNLSVNGVVTTGNGAIATPSYSFNGDLNTGMYWVAADTLGFVTGGVERARFSSAGALGVGVAPSVRMHVRAANLDTMQTVARFECGNVAATDFHYLDVSVDAVANIVQLASTGTNVGGFTFLTGATERMRIDGGGNVAIGTATVTHALNVANGAISITGNSSSVGLFVGHAIRHTGTTTFFIDGTSGGTAAGITFRDGSGFTQRLVIEAAGNTRPGADNSLSLGTASFRWSQLFAGTSTINTSDERDKVWRGPLNDDEKAAARAIMGELGFFQWSDAVEEKGEDARLHFGVRAQRVWAIMAEHGLVDPIDRDGRPGKTPYAFLCFDEWDDFYEDVPVKGEDGEEEVTERRLTQPAGHRYGLRLDQLSLFLIAGVMGALN